MREELGKYCGRILKASVYKGTRIQRRITNDDDVRMCGSWRLAHREDLVRGGKDLLGWNLRQRTEKMLSAELCCFPC